MSSKLDMPPSIAINLHDRMNLRHHYLSALVAAFILTLSLFGCVKEQELLGDEVARVNDRVLTAGEVSAWELSLRQPYVPEELRRSYIRHWVEKELLYQEALHRDLLSDPWSAERIEDATRSILISRLMELEYRNLSPLTPAEIRIYYLDHAAEFVWDQNHLNVQYWRSHTRRGMDELRENLFRGRQDALWTGDAGTLDQGSLSLKHDDAADPALWRALSRLAEGQISPVILLNNDFWVFKVIDIDKSGDRKELEEVREEIVARLTEERRRRYRESLIQHLVWEYHRDGRLRWSDAADTAARADTLSNVNREQ